ncbi:MAG: cytochrome C oxidase subunit II [Bdellovibrio sp.]|nr:MAG: cytochrome C oxidase subunit II [Bdellovibrio sp.]
MEYIIERASSFAGDIDFLIVLIAVLGGFWLLLAEAVLFYFIVKYRRKASPKAQYITGEEEVSKKWLHWPHYAVIVCDLFIIFFAIQTWVKIKQTLPKPDAVIEVVGQQWAWKFTHPGLDGKLGTKDDVKTVDELHVVVNKTYQFKLKSDDVLHSFSIPVFRLKQDAVPGRTITGWFKPTKTGQFDIQCAEICGIGHGIMGAKLYIETEEEHRTWLEHQRMAQVNGNRINTAKK